MTGNSDIGEGVHDFVHRHRAEFDTTLEVVQGRVVQYPRTIISRSYLELLDLVERGLKPSTCDYCGMLFPPRRAGQRYCPGTSCGTDGYFAQYEKTPYRREYQRQYKRFKRGTITQDDWDGWRDAHPGPEAWNEGDNDGER